MSDGTALTVTDGGQHYEFTPAGLIVHGAPTWEEYEATFARLRGAHDALLWNLGDLLNDGERRWGEMYVQVAELTGYDAAYLRNVKYVAAKYGRHERYAGGHLKWSHHRVIAALPAGEREALLARGQREQWTVQEFRNVIKRTERPKQKPVEGVVVEVCPETGRVELRCTGEAVGALRAGQAVSLLADEKDGEGAGSGSKREEVVPSLRETQGAE